MALVIYLFYSRDTHLRDHRYVLCIRCLAWLALLIFGIKHNLIGSCSIIFDPELKGWATVSAIGPLLFDTSVMLSTLFALRVTYRSYARASLLKAFLHDGILYYL